MQVDYSLILSAGFGTRMGKIGKKLPKPIWPLFESNLLEIQHAYLEKLFKPNEFYINTHHQAPKIEKIAKNKQIKSINEKEILGSGGAIFNFANLISRNGTLLVHNGDQFCFYSDNLIQKAFDMLKSHPVVLFGANLPKELGHNGLEVDDKSYIKGFKKNNEFSKKVLTYSGTALIDLKSLDKKNGYQDFFGNIADFINEEIPLLVSDNIEYWDFGTLNRYYYSVKKLIEGRDSQMYRFMTNNNLLDEKKLTTKFSYNSNKANCFNFSSENLIGEKNSIILNKTKKIEENHIHYEGILDKLI